MKIVQDLHIHTNLSSCAKAEATVANYIPELRAAGIASCGFANHFWDERIPGACAWYQPQNFAHLNELKKELAKADECGIRMLFGAEVEYSYLLHQPAVTEAIAAEFDYLLAPISHTHLTMPKAFYDDRQQHADYMVQAFTDVLNSPIAPYITAIPHPFHAVCCPYPHEELLPLIGETRFGKLFDAAAAKGIAMEINLSVFRQYNLAQIETSRYLAMFQIAKKCGCQFTFGSDAHFPAAIPTWERAYFFAELLELKESDIRTI